MTLVNMYYMAIDCMWYLNAIIKIVLDRRYVIFQELKISCLFHNQSMIDLINQSSNQSINHLQPTVCVFATVLTDYSY